MGAHLATVQVILLSHASIGLIHAVSMQLSQLEEFLGPDRLQALPFLFSDRKIQVHCPGHKVRSGAPALSASFFLALPTGPAVAVTALLLLCCSLACHRSARDPPLCYAAVWHCRACRCSPAAACRKSRRHTCGASMPGVALTTFGTARPTALCRPARMA